MALADCHMAINRQTAQFCKVRDCEVSHPSLYITIFQSQLPWEEGKMDLQAGRTEERLLEVKAKQHKACLSDGDFLWWRPYILPARETWRSSAVEEISSHHPSLACKLSPQFSSSPHVSIGLSSESSCGISVCNFPHDLGGLWDPKVRKKKSLKATWVPKIGFR